MRSLTITTFNMHKGMSPLNRRVQLPNIAHGLAKLSPDLLFLQEVQGKNALRSLRFSDWPSEAQHHYLARRLSHKAAYGLNAAYNHGHHGNAILSRYPLSTRCNVDISVNRLEQRGLLHCDLQLTGWPVKVAALCVHLNLLAHDRRKQLAKLRSYIDHAIPTDTALIMAGDFNDWRGEASSILAGELGLNEVFESLYGRHARSFPARMPMLPLDRIYVRGLSPVAAEVHQGLPWAALSDHLPLTAKLVLLPSQS
ncbi:endonuclease/exonuclease/phosphatase family protein [Crenobacter cavernae]|uniref:EEP domain-containing protein n=1 Tax=Crenobacter cavernae TaxID=2290923 RepID=A0A345Y9I9_9NEIS|nr:endonuclease/exonuclease/phosphatase family protein [Crenobacter cavernae]AXK40591.1 EEP domain-containing protein [Crenobacter cavernae]